jgi:ubiquitin-protein ligase E3 B
MASTSSENLELFNYIGKLLGKAVYEGIVLDVHFAPFFLRHLSHHSANALYSSIDDLPSFDPELAKNLAYVKHCEDASDLGLNFEWTEDILGTGWILYFDTVPFQLIQPPTGQMKSYELRTGGRDIAVTNQNRISYIHSVAHFRLFRQIKAQSAAFSVSEEHLGSQFLSIEPHFAAWYHFCIFTFSEYKKR